MLTSGDIVELDLGTPVGSEARMRRPAVLITADRILSGRPDVVQVVPLTRSVRDSLVEISIEPDARNGLTAVSSIQCQHVRSVSTQRLVSRIGNIGPATLHQVRDTLAILIDL